MLNPEFQQKVVDSIAESNREFQNFAEADCGCVRNFGYCCCTNLERACRFVSRSKGGVYFNEAQRETIRLETVRYSEGSYDAAEVETMTDAELAAAWLEAVAAYVASQF
jgi:hypothetical protein